MCSIFAGRVTSLWTRKKFLFAPWFWFSQHREGKPHMGEGLSLGYALPGLLMARSKTSSWYQYTQASLNILGNSRERDNFKHAIEAFKCRPSPLQFLQGAWHQRETRWYWHTWGFWKLGQREIAGFSFVFWPCYPIPLSWTSHQSCDKPNIPERTLSHHLPRAPVICQSAQRLCFRECEFSLANEHYHEIWVQLL